MSASQSVDDLCQHVHATKNYSKCNNTNVVTNFVPEKRIYMASVVFSRFYLNSTNVLFHLAAKRNTSSYLYTITAYFNNSRLSSFRDSSTYSKETEK